ncbi:MAG: GTPase domain-containing protein [Legionella sp.]|nr:GTPase domain-containing protein [Legionella sp.]
MTFKPLNIVVLGQKMSGKTQIVNKLLGKKFEEKYKPTPDSNTYYKDNFTITDYGKKNLTHDSDKVFDPPIDIALICIDLTQQETQLDYAREITESLKHVSPATKIIIIGTKFDRVNALNPIKFDQLKNLTDGDYLICSAKSNFGLDSIKNNITLAQAEKAKANLEEIILQHNDQQALNKCLRSLEAKIKSESLNPSQKIASIKHFENQCKNIIDPKHVQALKAVLAFTTAAITAIITISCGFILGFACGAWTGPGAFVTALLGAGTAAIAVTGTAGLLGSAAGGLAGFGLFKRTPVQQVTKQTTSHAIKAYAQTQIKHLESTQDNLLLSS